MGPGPGDPNPLERQSRSRAGDPLRPEVEARTLSGIFVNVSYVFSATTVVLNRLMPLERAVVLALERHGRTDRGMIGLRSGLARLECRALRPRTAHVIVQRLVARDCARKGWVKGPKLPVCVRCAGRAGDVA